MGKLALQLLLPNHRNSPFKFPKFPVGLRSPTIISPNKPSRKPAQPNDQTIKVWDLLSGKEIASFSGDGAFMCCAISPDGMTVVAGDVWGRVHFLRLEGMKQGDGRDTTMPFSYDLNNPVTFL